MKIEQNNFSVSTLSLDLNNSLHESKDLHFLLNGQFTSHSNNEYDYFVQNMASNYECLDLATELEGVIKLDKEYFALFTKETISLFDASTCTNTHLVSDSCLKFKDVTGVYKYVNYNKVGSGRRIYFANKGGELMFFDIDKDYPKKRTTKCKECKSVYTKRLDCDKLKVWKNVHYPKLDIKKSTGNIPSGKYQFAIAFNDDKLRISDYFIYPEVITVSPYEKVSLSINFDCFETDSDYELVLITNREDRGTVAQRIGYFESSQTSVGINQIDKVEYVPIDTKILLSTKSYYQGIEQITYNSSTTDGELILAGLTERQPINYWKQAFNIKSNWVEVQVPAKDAYKIQSAMRDEVYGVELAWIFPDGQISNRTHVPNTVVAKPEWLVDVSNNDTWTTDCDSVPKKYWEIYNTAEQTSCKVFTTYTQEEVCQYQVYSDTNGSFTVTADIYLNEEFTQVTLPVASYLTIYAKRDTVFVSGFYENVNPQVQFIDSNIQPVKHVSTKCVEEGIQDTDLCEYKITKRGNFGYWESGLKYPDHDNFGSYRCKGIRHFKFPDNAISNHHVTIDGKEYVNILGIQLSNIERPKDCDGNYIPVIGYIVYALDRSNHKSILHKGFISNMFKEELSDCSTSYYNNYPFNDLNPDVFLSKTLTHGDIRNSFKPVTDYSKDKFTYISPDVDYIRNTSGEELVLYSEENGFVRGGYHSTREFPEIKFLSDSFYTTLGAATAGTFALQLIGNVGIFGTGSQGGAGTSSIPLILETYNNLLKGFLPYDNYGINYLCFSDYSTNNFSNITQGNKRRKLEYSNYLLPSKQIQNGDKINNYQREQGLYIKLNREIADPSVKEYSRVRTKDAECKDFDKNYIFNPATGNSQRATSSSYYVGFKVSQPNQYGNLNNDIGVAKYTTTDLDGDFFTTPVIFIGDVYITKHKKLRKFPFFTALPPSGYNDVGLNLRPSFNVWKPRFWFNYTQKNPIGAVVENIPIIRFIKDLFDKSDYNFEYGNEREKANCGDSFNCVTPTTGDIGLPGGRTFRNDGSIYTHAIGVMEYWCESEFVADYREYNEIPESNLEVDDSSLIKYNRVTNPELSLYNLQYLWKGVLANNLNAKTTINCCNINNTANDRIIFSQKNNIESTGDKWLSFPPLNYHQFNNTDGNLTKVHRVDDGNLMFFFENAVYVTQSDTGLVSTNGIVYAGEGDIFKRRMKKLSDDETGLSGCIDADSIVNTRYGVFWVDSQRKRVFLYDGRPNDITDGVRSWANEYMETTGNIKATFDNYTDLVFFSSDTWTISYMPKNKSWNSYHSFIPDRYIQLPNNFITLKENKLWKHNAKYDYCNYYGKQYKFDIGFTVNNKFQVNTLQSIKVYTEFIKELGYGSKIYTNNFFDHIIAYNQKTSTGLKLIQLNSIDNNDNPKYTVTDFTYNVNNFRNVADGQPLVEFKPTDYTMLNTNPKNKGNIVGYYHKVHLISNQREDKILLKLNIAIEQEYTK